MSERESRWNQLFDQLRDSHNCISLVATGGGTGAVARCFRREGASHNFVEATIPYSRAALIEYLGSTPVDSSASAPVARQLASVALERARRLSGRDSGSQQLAGVALVAALPTSPPRRGQDRIHVALQTRDQLLVWSLELSKDAHTRQYAESIADEMVYLALAELVDHTTQKSLRANRFFEDAGLRPVKVGGDA